MESEEIIPKRKLLDRAAQFGGTWKFIILYAVIFTFWVVFNLISLTTGVNPYVFILINLVLSGIAAIQAPAILMSQNRQQENLTGVKRETQIKSLEQKMDLLLEDQKKTISEAQEKQIALLKEMNLKLDALKHRGF